MANIATDIDHFRDTVSTVDKEGKRVWLFPRKPFGKYFNARKMVSYGLLTILFVVPLLKINGLPVLMLNFPARKFIIFGQIFWPQDFFILLLAFLTLVVFIILFTVIYGRVFCGWVCPQTIFMEMVFRRIEYWIEGDYTKQKALSKAPWNREKILKKGTKHTIFLAISILFANIFLAYIIGIDELKAIVLDSPLDHLVGLGTLLVFAGIFYWVYASFREQVCTIVCPYGRLQGVMMDKKTTVIAYDFVRGEPREKQHKGQGRTAGDCIDCFQCVQVCPTGIDIRNGTQLECINCTACIDACNNIMDLVKKPHGLIRYDSMEGIEKGDKWKFTSRIKGYSAVLVILIVILVALLVTRNNVDATILRTPGMLFQKSEKGNIINLYNISVINKTNAEMRITLKLLEPAQGKVQVVKNNLVLPKQGISEGVFLAEIPPAYLKGINSEIKIGVYSQGELIAVEETKFMGPAQ